MNLLLNYGNIYVYGDDNVIFKLVTQQWAAVFTDGKCTLFSEKYTLSHRSVEEMKKKPSIFTTRSM